MRWPRERGHVSPANFQVSDDIVGRSLGQIAGKRENKRKRESLHHEDRSRRGGSRVASTIPEDMPLPFSRNETSRLARHVEYVSPLRCIKFQRNYGGLRFFRGIIGEDLQRNRVLRGTMMFAGYLANQPA